MDAVINVSELSDTDKAQIEDIIKRKTGFAADKITINIYMQGVMNNALKKCKRSQRNN